MSQIVLKTIDYDKIFIKECFNKYIIYYQDDFNIIGIPIQCNGEILTDDDNYKFYVDDKTYEILSKVENIFKEKLNKYNNFINKDCKGHYLFFTNNFYTNNKLNDSITELYLNIKFINKSNYNTVIHII